MCKIDVTTWLSDYDFREAAMWHHEADDSPTRMNRKFKIKNINRLERVCKLKFN
jgi:hypothetical protein